MANEPSGTLHVSSMFGAATRQPIVVLTYDAPGKEFEVQMTVATARNHAQDILEVAESAVADAFLFEFVSKTLGGGDELASQTIADFRVWRANNRA